jgi:predicted N-acetyltransferase YhbS
MVRWALDQCEAEGYPAYVESTVESLPFYEKLGFKVAGRISMDLREVAHEDTADLYKEVGCIYTPESKAGLLDPDASRNTL